MTAARSVGKRRRPGRAARRRGRRRLSALVVLPPLIACQRALPPAQVAPSPAAPPAREAYVSSVTGVAFGNAFARATADGAPSTDDRPSGADQAVDAAASRDGDELQRSCGRDGSRSHAQATAAFQPLNVARVSQLGFALSTTAYAKGGVWRERRVLCREVHHSVAAADARATGRIDLTFGASGDSSGVASEELILRVSGATPREAHLEVRDGRDQPLVLTSVPGEPWVTATLPRPGAYSVRASIATHAESEGGARADQRGTAFSVSVQSMRDALALGHGEGAATTLVLPLPVFMSTEAMSAALDSALFTDRHRLYPCAMVDCGTDRLRDVFLEQPRVSTRDGAVVLEMRLAGSYPIALSLAGNVTGAVRATAMPVVEHDTLRFESPSIDVATHNLIVKWRAAGFERKLLERIGNVRIDLTPQLQAAVARAQEHFSGSWGGACVLLAPTEAHLRSVKVVTTAPQGVVANFGIALSEASGGACEKRKVGR